MIQRCGAAAVTQGSYCDDKIDASWQAKKLVRGQG